MYFLRSKLTEPETDVSRRISMLHTSVSASINSKWKAFYGFEAGTLGFLR